MLPSFRRSSAILIFATGALAACGGAGSPAGPDAAPGAPAPAPTPVPTPDPRVNMARGPVTRFTIKPRIAEPDVRDAQQDAQGRFILNRGERVDVDGTQKNAANEICAWANPPVYLINDRPMEFNTGNGVVYRRGSSQPFLLKMNIDGRGTFSVRGTIDGIDSNVLEFVVQ